MGDTAAMLDAAQRSAWDSDGFFILPGFADPNVCKAMLERVSELCARAESGQKTALEFRMP